MNLAWILLKCNLQSNFIISKKNIHFSRASELVMKAEGFDEENKPSVDISIEEVRNLIKLEQMEELEKNSKTQLLAELVTEVDSEPR
jgi:hypothetical protein